MTTDFVLDALERALYDRRPDPAGGLIHHSDRGSQYVSIRYSERLGQAGINPSVGSTRDACGLLGSIGDIPPAEAGQRYYQQLADRAAEPVLL